MEPLNDHELLIDNKDRKLALMVVFITVFIGMGIGFFFGRVSA